IFVAGVFPGVLYYITKWYKNSEQFFAGTMFAGAFSGLLAFVIMGLDGKGWQWIFLIDDLAMVFVALFSYYLISSYPETTTWITENERKIVINRLQLDSGHINTNTTDLDKSRIFEAFKDWVGSQILRVNRLKSFHALNLFYYSAREKVYIASLIQFTTSLTGHAFSFFLQAIVNGLGFDS
ncbi:36021_t:CDS:2, partial [Racocetra persica]